MGGLGPGIGGLEYLLIAAVALIVVGPERLPGLLRKLGQMIGKARRMADEFRSSFDEMARQSELDDLRKEVEALRTNQGVVRLGDEADAAFKDIKTELNKTDDAPRSVMAENPQPPLGHEKWPDSPPVMTPLDPKPTDAATKPKATTRKAAPAKTGKSSATRKIAAKPAAAKPVATRVAAKPKPATPAKPRSRAPANSKLDL